jgi:predicted DNA-binding transcriptional regulator YafY
MGAPIEYDRERKGFYYSDRTWSLGALPLTEGELLTVLLAARVAEQYRGSPVAKQLHAVFERLAELLPGNLSIAPELLYSRFTFTAPPARPLREEVWTPVVRGLLAQRTVRMIYRPFDAGATRKGKESRVNPYHIANLQGEWYLFGVHAGYGDVRQFAMGRIESATATDEPFAVPADFDAGKLLDGAFARFTGDWKPVTVRLLFDQKIAHWVADRPWHLDQALKTRKSGEVELSFPAKGLYEVQRWVLSWGAQVRVLAPADLAKAVHDEVAEMASRQLGVRRTV